MYHIKFKLPNGAGGMAAGHASAGIRKQLRAWSEQYGIPLKTETMPYLLIAKLALDKDATWFALTWQGRKYDSIHKVQDT